MLVEIRKWGKEERVAVTSVDVAKTFGKEHKHVLRDIRELGCSEEFNRSNFGPISHTNSMNQKIATIQESSDFFRMKIA